MKLRFVYAGKCLCDYLLVDLSKKKDRIVPINVICSRIILRIATDRVGALRILALVYPNVINQKLSRELQVRIIDRLERLRNGEIEYDSLCHADQSTTSR